MGQARHRPRRVRPAARARDGLAGAGCSSATAATTAIQIFDQDGKFIEEWTQFSRPSGVYIDKNDILYVADSESDSVSQNHTGWKRGIRIGSVEGRQGHRASFPIRKRERRRHFAGTSAAEGVAVDAPATSTARKSGRSALKRYVKK